MNHSIVFTIILFVLFFNVKAQKYTTPKRTVVSGKVLNFKEDNKKVRLSILKLGFPETKLFADLDDKGNFSTSFETYTPMDLSISCKSYFNVLVHPGDSIYVEFDGVYNENYNYLKTVKFSGNSAKLNQDVALFQYLYLTKSPCYDYNAKEVAAQKFNADQYKQYLDTLSRKDRLIYDEFVNLAKPDDEAKTWALSSMDKNRLSNLYIYPDSHRRLNKLTKKDWDVPFDFLDELKDRLPISESSFISAHQLWLLINWYHYSYVLKKLYAEEDNKKYATERGYAFPLGVMDSLSVYGVLKYTKDSLMRQMELAYIFSDEFERSEVDCFEKYRDVFEQYVKEPYLREPLLRLYQKTKENIEKPNVASETIFKGANTSSLKQILDSIKTVNKGKVIYIDCWATWCGPCRAEMPNSKTLMAKMAGKDVAFVYLCIDSDKKTYNACLNQFEIGGQQYFLTSEQSSDLRKFFEISGIPFYILLDKNGMVSKKGSHLRPLWVENEINELLK